MIYFVKSLPDPRGRKSLPTTLSNTDDFPELFFNNQKRKKINIPSKAKIYIYIESSEMSKCIDFIRER